MKTDIFVNKFLTIGMNDFFYDGNPSSFERHIVECLVDICGFDGLKKAYDNRDENLFYNILNKYCKVTSLYDSFLQNCRKFSLYEEKKEIGDKSNIYSSYIEICLIKMFLQKYLNKKPSPEEVSHFENNLLNNFDIIKWHLANNDKPNLTRDEWNRKKKILSDDVILVEIKPEYLDPYTYAKYGVDLDSVKKMDYRMVNELNEYIKKRMLDDKEDDELEKEKTIKLTPTSVITSGNGFVDAILMISIIITELSLGFIYLFLHM